MPSQTRSLHSRAVRLIACNVCCSPSRHSGATTCRQHYCDTLLHITRKGLGEGGHKRCPHRHDPCIAEQSKSLLWPRPSPCPSFLQKRFVNDTMGMGRWGLGRRESRRCERRETLAVHLQHHTCESRGATPPPRPTARPADPACHGNGARKGELLQGPRAICNTGKAVSIDREPTRVEQSALRALTRDYARRSRRVLRPGGCRFAAAQEM